MTNRMRDFRVFAVAGFAMLMWACDGGSPSIPTKPSAGVPVAPSPPSVTSISPTVGSTGGATWVTITGVGLGSTVAFGGTTVTGTFDGRYPGALMFLATPAHAAGIVDVVLTANGRSVTMPNAFRYASPDAFDFNGSWSGFGWNGQDNAIRFTIRDNRLLVVSCDGIATPAVATVAFSPPLPVTNSEFSFDGDGVRFSGRIVSPSMATGTIRLGECASDGWYAAKP